jgi:hypothetical protein
MAVLTTLVTLAGCGGLSDEEYADRAGTICHDATAPLKSRVKGQDFGDLARLTPEASKRYATALKRFEELEPPDARREHHQVLLDAGRDLQASHSGQALIDRVELLARLEPPRNAAAVHDRMVRELSRYAQALVTRNGSGDPALVLAAIREARQALRLPPKQGKPA